MLSYVENNARVLRQAGDVGGAGQLTLRDLGMPEYAVVGTSKYITLYA